MEYFDITIEFLRTEIHDNFVKNFYDLLGKCCMVLKGGFWKAEGLSTAEIILKNQQYILSGIPSDDSNYNPVFQYMDFSDIRCYWDLYGFTLKFIILIPESDLYDYGGRNNPVIKNRKRMNSLIKLSSKIWEQMPVAIIQTAWECSYVPQDAETIYKTRGITPQAEPFAIVSNKPAVYAWNHEQSPIARDGVLLVNDNNWFPI